MTAYDYDVYIGSGHGTFDGAAPLAAKGKKVAVVGKILLEELAQIVDVMPKLLDSPVL